MAKKINYEAKISKLYDKGTYQKLPENEAQERVKNILSKYPVKTQRKVLNQREKLGTSYSDLHTFLIATERYNKNRQMRYKNVINKVVNPAWEKYVNRQSNAWQNEIYDDNGGMSRRGWDVYNRFVDDMLADIVPTKDKSFVLSDTQMKYISFDKTLFTRMEMGNPGYITKRQNQYFKNYEKALKTLHKDPNDDNKNRYVDKYNELTTAQKIEFSYQAQGYIQYQYTLKDTEEVFKEFSEAIDAIKAGK